MTLPQSPIDKLVTTLISNADFTKADVLQKLWSNYGEIARYVNEQNNTSLISKSVSPPKVKQHSRGWNTNAGHQRKVASYVIESSFYQYYAHLCDVHCYVPQYINSIKNNHEQQVLLMQDLTAGGYPLIKKVATDNDIKAVIKWLAYFHARFLNEPADKLAAVGSYWHLHTRLEEHQQMADSDVKAKAFEIDDTLNSAKYQTIIHGDAKLANFCFADKSCDVAAVDFQYVGLGVGVKDLAYFLGSCLDENRLIAKHDELLDEYFNQLKNALAYYQNTCDVNELIHEWRTMYQFSCADFYRFLLGWSPKHPKINAYLIAQSGLAIKRLKASIK